ncbi:MAG: TrbG/VirB9 family P-type conjugative transfer protein [Alphaproteobacteria bacterium]|jgi:type IV secretory pathway VirB9-like protein|nr:TrbG/VirB9 family P-type conjugative transfer protein [Alphaproteobacteria bacterium]OJV12555.1 MAG: hypothetical protein BGO27_03425 [Alphaproteobacteria bacterium 33-17]
MNKNIVSWWNLSKEKKTGASEASAVFKGCFKIVSRSLPSQKAIQNRRNLKSRALKAVLLTLNLNFDVLAFAKEGKILETLLKRIFLFINDFNYRLFKKTACLALGFCSIINIAEAAVKKDEFAETLPEDNQIEKNDLRKAQKAFLISSDPKSIMYIDYKQDKVSKLKIRMHLFTHVVLPEAIKSVALKDNVGFSVMSADDIKTIFSLSTNKAGIDTSFTVIGESGTIYPFYLSSYDTDEDVIGDMVVYVRNPEIKGYTPKSDDKLKHKIAQSRYDFLENVADPDKINTKYKIRGNQDIAPMAVYDDGEKTFFDFRKPLMTGGYPVIYKRVDGVDAPLQLRFHQGHIIASSISNSWTIIDGDKVVCVEMD